MVSAVRAAILVKDTLHADFAQSISWHALELIIGLAAAPALVVTVRF